MNANDSEPGWTALFVYGTLKRGFPAHGLLHGAVGGEPARTVAAFRLVNLGAYPGLVAGEVAVEGEVYQVTFAQLAALDDYEGKQYRRVTIGLEGGASAQTYLLVSPFAETGRPLAGPRWEGPGDRER